MLLGFSQIRAQLRESGARRLLETNSWNRGGHGKWIGITERNCGKRKRQFEFPLATGRFFNGTAVGANAKARFKDERLLIGVVVW